MFRWFRTVTKYIPKFDLKLAHHRVIFSMKALSVIHPLFWIVRVDKKPETESSGDRKCDYDIKLIFPFELDLFVCLSTGQRGSCCWIRKMRVKMKTKRN